MRCLFCLLATLLVVTLQSPLNAEIGGHVNDTSPTTEQANSTIGQFNGDEENGSKFNWSVLIICGGAITAAILGGILVHVCALVLDSKYCRDLERNRA
nr:hypothetical protein HmN_000803000 [Hymenolepis microstoma]